MYVVFGSRPGLRIAARRGLVAILLACVSAVSHAQLNKIEIKYVDDVKIRAHLNISQSNVKGNKISGTKIEVICGGSAGLAYVGNPNLYGSVLVYRAKLKVGGVQLYDNTYFDPTGGGGGGTTGGGGSTGGGDIGGGGLGGGGGGPSAGASAGFAPQILELPEYAQIAAPNSARFASTEFAHNTTVTVELTVYFAFYTNSQNPQYVKSDSVTAVLEPVAYNVATMYGRNEWEITSYGNGTTPASTKLASMNHDVSRKEITKGWARNSILGAMEASTAFYVNTHGNWWLEPDPNDPLDEECGSTGDPAGPRFWTDFDELNFTPDDEYVFPFRSSSRRLPSTHWQYDLNPQVYEVMDGRTGTIPRMNLAWLDACVTGRDNEFAAAFLHPIDYDQSGNAINQSELGWRIFTAIVATNQDGYAFWGKLLERKTAHEARDALVAKYLQQVPRPNPYPYTHYVSVWGDYYTRLYGVWTGNDTLPSTTWYIVYPGP